MANKMIRQSSFNAGEADQVTWKRTDIESYLTAAQKLLNCEVGTTGLVKKRKGTVFELNATNYASQESTMYEFVDKNGEYYLILGAQGAFYVFGVPESESFVATSSGLLVETYTGSLVTIDDPTLSFVQTIPTDYNASDLAGLDYTQDNDSLILTSPLYQPGRIFISSYAPLTFAHEYLNIYPLPAYDFNKVNYNATTVTIGGSRVSGGTMTIAFSTLPATAVYNNAWVGGQIVGGGVSATSPIGYGIITIVSQVGTTVTFTILVQVAFDSGVYSTVGSQYSIRQPAWVGEPNNPYGLGYPAKVLYFQNRLWFGNTLLLPNTVFGSKINQPISFDVGTGRETDAIVYTLGQTYAGEILWLNGGKQLEVYTTNYEFVAPQNDDIGLTPGSFSIRQQSSHGSSNLLKPQTYFNDSYFVQKTGKALINYHFDGVGLAYKSTNIAQQSQHLVKNPESRALLRGTDTSQDNFIYFLNQADNTITAFQFSNEVGLAALTPMQFKTLVTVDGVQSVEDIDLVDIVTVENHVYILKYYTNTQTYTIERLQSETYIDNSQSKQMTTTGLINGLSILEGYEVQVVYQNQDFGKYTVSGGVVTADNPLGDSGTVQVGLLYDVEIKPMYPFYSATSAAFQKQLNRVYVDYYESLNFFINGKLVQYQDFAEIQAGLPLVPKTDTAIFSPFAGYSRFDPSAIVITQSSPFDLQILSIGYEIDMAVI